MDFAFQNWADPRVCHTGQNLTVDGGWMAA
jgi:hypothetical protein